MTPSFGLVMIVKANNDEARQNGEDERTELVKLPSMCYAMFNIDFDFTQLLLELSVRASCQIYLLSNVSKFINSFVLIIFHFKV